MRPVGEGNQAGEETVGYEQARRLRATMAAANIDRAQLWMYYFGIGGHVGEYELDAYLHHSLLLPRLQRDLFAQAANEILTNIAPPQAPYASDVLSDRAAPTQEEANSPDQDAQDTDHRAPGSPEH